MRDDDEVQRPISEWLDAPAKTDSKHMPAPTEDQRTAFKSLWDMVVRFSEREDSDEYERFRMAQMRGKVAVLAGVSDLLDRETFDREVGRYVDVIARAMGGMAFRLAKEPPESSG